LALFLLNQPQSALQTELNGFFQQVTGAALESCQVTASAFCKARHKLDPTVFEALNQVVQAQLDAQGLRYRWRGLRLLGIDGSSVHLPLEDRQASHFGTHQGLPVARLSQLIDLGDGQTLHSLLVSPTICERGCAQSHLDHAPSGSLILFDRGYPAHWLFADLAQRRIPFVMRLRLNFNRAVRDFVQSGDRETQHTFTCTNWLSRQVCQQSGTDLDGPVTLRLVRVDLPGGTTEVLATSLLDAQAFPAADFADLYHRRWGIETDYRRLKQTLNLENFSGRSPQAVQQDLHARILLKNLALLMQTLQQPEIDRRHAQRKHRWQPNFTQGLSCLKNSLVRLLLNPTRALLSGLLELIASALGAIRPGRSSSRKRRRCATKGCEGYKPTR